jgi:hypothetical protein
MRSFSLERGTGPVHACQQPGPCLPIPRDKDMESVPSNRIRPVARRVPTLDGARHRGIHVQFYDPDGHRYGIPTYPYHWARKAC